MRTNKSKWVSEDIVDTRNLQIFALCEFMSALKYEWNTDEFWWVNPGFTSNHFSNKGREHISICSAVKLFNGNSVKCIFGKPPATLSIWSFNDYFITKAKASRILQSVKLQLCKSTKTIICQDHRVKFITPSFKVLFLGNRYL